MSGVPRSLEGVGCVKPRVLGKTVTPVTVAAASGKNCQGHPPLRARVKRARALVTDQATDFQVCLLLEDLVNADFCLVFEQGLKLCHSVALGHLLQTGCLGETCWRKWGAIHPAPLPE